MSELSQHRFSWLFNELADLRPVHDTVVFESAGFSVIPSLGSLVPGWLLLIPKRSAQNLSELNFEEVSDLKAVAHHVSEMLTIFPGDVQFFEHGGFVGSTTACGVDQAHLHALPLGFDLVHESISEGSMRWHPTAGVRALPDLAAIGREYLFVSNSSGSFVAFPDQPTSQWFRRLIARRLGAEGEWNYNYFPGHENIAATLSKLAA